MLETPEGGSIHCCLRLNCTYFSSLSTMQNNPAGLQIPRELWKTFTNSHIMIYCWVRIWFMQTMLYLQCYSLKSINPLCCVSLSFGPIVTSGGKLNTSWQKCHSLPSTHKDVGDEKKIPVVVTNNNFWKSVQVSGTFSLIDKESKNLYLYL